MSAPPDDQVFAPGDRPAPAVPAIRRENLINKQRTLPRSTVFTRDEARACGWSDQALSRAIRSGRLIRVRHGVLTAQPELSEHLSALGAVRACRGSVISHRSALLVHGLPVVGERPALPELTVPPRMIGRLANAHLHRATLFEQDVTCVDDVPLTTVARTVIDVARSRSTATGVAAIDAALHRRLATMAELDDVLLRCWNWPGIRRAQRTMRLVDGRAESPLESVSRLVLRSLRLAVPDIQPLLLDEYHHAVARLDFYWDEVGVAGEADGRSKYDERPVLTAEKERQEVGEDLGVVFTRWGWYEVNRPRLLRLKVERAFERGRLRDRSGFRREWSVVPT